MRNGAEIQQALRAFASTWDSYAGTERAEAQTFLNELFACYGSTRKAVGAEFESFKKSAGFMDLHWPSVCIFEMKAPSRSKNLARAREQVLDYWRESSDPDADRAAARWVVLCSFQRFEIWEPGRFPTAPRLNFDLSELPDRYEALSFLAGSTVEPSFATHYKELTRDAASLMSELYVALKDRSAAPLDEIQRFVLQAVWALFAEDLGMLEGYPLQSLVGRLIGDPSRSSAADIGFLFRVLNQKGGHNRKGLYAGTRYVNGDLFARPGEVELNTDELHLLRRAAEYDWCRVNPTIFGSLMEGVLGPERRRELGAHYTHEVDIQKIVGPTIIQPWQEKISLANSSVTLRSLLDDLCSFKVLDPACGCGNFLYVAYRELRSLELQIKRRYEEVRSAEGLPADSGSLPYFPLTNMLGIEIEQVSVLIARITLWMGHRQMIDEIGEAEAPLPLVDLSGIRVGDALRVEWPGADCIIGNPPFLGASHIRSKKGDVYAEWLARHFGVGIKDYCVYWFRRAHMNLLSGGRAGLVGTNSISQNLGRSASLQFVVDNDGVITSAVSSQKWPGEAKVHVSIVNWVKHGVAAFEAYTLDGKPVKHIGSELRETEDDQWEPAQLPQNRRRCFEGPSPKAKGLVLSEAEALRLRARQEAPYAEVIRPYLTADDIADDPAQAPRRWALDFGLLPMEQARKYPAAFKIAKDVVQPERADNNRKSYREKYWLFAEPRKAMREALRPLSRYIATAGHAKRLVLCWCEPEVLASNVTNVFAFDDDYSMGILQSSAHTAWAWDRSSTIKADLRYTPTSTFMTFPWPDEATRAQENRVAELCAALFAQRSRTCAAEGIGLTELYNLMDDGAFEELRKAQLDLDRAVARCYGWPSASAQDHTLLVRLLRDRNEEIATGARSYVGPASAEP